MNGTSVLTPKQGASQCLRSSPSCRSGLLGGVGLHAHRAPDRARDHRHPARDRGAVVPRLQGSRQQDAAQANVRSAIPAPRRTTQTTTPTRASRPALQVDRLRPRNGRDVDRHAGPELVLAVVGERAGDRQRSDNAACARIEHFPNFRKREAEPLSSQNKFDAVSIVLAEKRGLPFAPRKQALALIESQCAYRDTGLLRQLSDGKSGGYRRRSRIVPGTANTAALVPAAFVLHPRPAANLEFVRLRQILVLQLPASVASGCSAPKILLPFLPKFAPPPAPAKLRRVNLNARRNAGR